MKQLIYILISGFLLTMSPMAEALPQSGGQFLIEFNTSAAESNMWRAVNDGVMGGRSSGGPMLKNSNLVFEGVINTNGGGFSSVRRPVQGREIAGALMARMRVKSDGRAYKLTFRTNITYWGRRISFQQDIPKSEAGTWQTVDIPLTNMRASLFGRTISGARFVPGDAVEMGIILADGQDGPFRIEVEWIGLE